MASKTISKIVWPRASLAGCVFCMIVRDTRGADLKPLERFNVFPASPLCCVTFLSVGDMHLITQPSEMEQPWLAASLPELSFSGAQLGPLVSWNPADVHAMTVAFYPDAFSQMTGLDLAAFKGRMVAADAVLPKPLLETCQAFFNSIEAVGIEGSFAGFEDRIEMYWAATRSEPSGPSRWLKDWTRGLVAKAALSGPGRSTRQIARRIRSWTGVSERDLQGLGQTEQLYANIHVALEAGEINWAHLAAKSGFSDQAHMIRRMRRHTGFTPEQLRQGAQNEEALWGYRLLGEYFSKPKP